ncbi:hypothetical protein NBRC116597_08160 [Phaeobacter sp. NW0010-22]
MLALAFLGTTALTPAPVSAAPVVAFVAGSIGVASGTALAASAAYASGAAFAATAVGSFVVKTIVAVGLSALASSLAPKPSLPPPAARMVNFAQPVSYAEFVYGRTRKGGPLGFTGFQNGRRYYVPILAAHPIEGVFEHWLDERTVTLSGEADPDVSNVATAPIAGYGRVDLFEGGSDQSANTGLVSAFEEITNAHDFRGLSGAVIWAARPPQNAFTEIYPGGRQWAYAPVIDGKNNIFDPRSGARGYTNNAALVIADWVVSILGRGVDWDEVADEADVCDQVVTNADGGTQKRWTLNGTLSDDQTYEDQRAQLAAACDAFIYERTDGKVGFTVGRWIEPDLILDDADFFALELSQGQWGADAPDEISAVYSEPENSWRETPSGTWVEEEKPLPVRDEPQLYMINSHNQAARVIKRIVKTKRAQYQIRATIGIKGYEILGGRGKGRANRFVRVVHKGLGIDQFFEIGELVREDAMTFTLVANSVKKLDFGFDAASEEPKRPSFESVTSDGSVNVPANFTGAAQDGGSLLFIWADQDAAFRQEVRYRETGTPYWVGVSTTQSTDRILVGGLKDGVAYQAQIRNVSAAGTASAWSPDPPIEVGVITDSVAPGDLSGFNLVEQSGNVVLSWLAANDGHYFGARIYRASGSTAFADAILIHTEYGVPGDGDDHVDPQPGYAIFSYWAEPINGSGVAGTRIGPISVELSIPGP